MVDVSGKAVVHVRPEPQFPPVHSGATSPREHGEAVREHTQHSPGAWSHHRLRPMPGPSESWAKSSPRAPCARSCLRLGACWSPTGSALPPGLLLAASHPPFSEAFPDRCCMGRSLPRRCPPGPCCMSLRRLSLSSWCLLYLPVPCPPHGLWAHLGLPLSVLLVADPRRLGQGSLHTC